MALGEVKSELIKELKKIGYEKLSGDLSNIDIDNFDKFLKSSVSNFHDKAFEIAGSTAEAYVAEYFSHVKDKIIPLDSPAGKIIKYFPADREAAKKIFLLIYNNQYEAAQKAFYAMIEENLKSSAKEFSQDIVV